SRIYQNSPAPTVGNADAIAHAQSISTTATTSRNDENADRWAQFEQFEPNRGVAEFDRRDSPAPLANVSFTDRSGSNEPTGDLVAEEVICIVRSRNNPNERRMIVVPKPSP